MHKIIVYKNYVFIYYIHNIYIYFIYIFKETRRGLDLTTYYKTKLYKKNKIKIKNKIRIIRELFSDSCFAFDLFINFRVFYVFHISCIYININISK